MQLGDFEITTVSGGRFLIDGGTMFGVVPRVLWSRLMAPDDQHRIRQATNCVLVRTGGRRILIDTGYGSKLSEKQRRIFTSEAGDPLGESLAEAGCGYDEVDMVILSHLHFDHAGGVTRHDEGGGLVDAFPNAQYVVQRREWMNATAGYPELRGAYPQENLSPLQSTGRLRFLDGDEEIIPGIRSWVTGGHTEAHQALIIESGGETAVFLGDICPTSHHLPVLWNMSYDVNLLELRRAKARVLGMVADQGWWACFDHDPDVAAARLTRESRRDFAIADAVAAM